MQIRLDWIGLYETRVKGFNYNLYSLVYGIIAPCLSLSTHKETRTITCSRSLSHTRSHSLSFTLSLIEGKNALKEINKKMGLGFDDWDLEFYTKMFTEQLMRNPTDVECFDLGEL